jgi:hypothetical protein
LNEDVLYITETRRQCVFDNTPLDVIRYIGMAGGGGLPKVEILKYTRKNPIAAETGSISYPGIV